MSFLLTDFFTPSMAGRATGEAFLAPPISAALSMLGVGEGRF